MSSTPVKRWSARRTTLILLVAGLLTAAAGAFAVWSYLASEDAIQGYRDAKASLTRAETARDTAQADYNERVAEEAAAKRAAEAAAAAAQAERDAQASQDASFADLGMQPVGDNVYFRWLDKDEYSCGRYDCSAFYLVAVDGCPNGLYLEAAIMSGGTQVDWTNETFSGVPAWGDASGFFDDIWGVGDSFSLTEVNCY